MWNWFKNQLGLSGAAVILILLQVKKSGPSIRCGKCTQQYERDASDVLSSFIQSA